MLVHLVKSMVNIYQTLTNMTWPNFTIPNADWSIQRFFWNGPISIEYLRVVYSTYNTTYTWVIYCLLLKPILSRCHNSMMTCFQKTELCDLPSCCYLPGNCCWSLCPRTVKRLMINIHTLVPLYSKSQRRPQLKFFPHVKCKLKKL